MKTLHCIDVSGSMSDDSLTKAKQEMLKRFKPGDVVVVFDTKFEVVTDMDRDLRSWMGYPGGTAIKPVVDYAKTIGAEPIIYSDGFFVYKDIEQFPQVVTIT